MKNDGVAYRNNSIDLLRLVAALQVLLGHGMNYLPGAQVDAIADAFKFLPGVPLFFFLSGFLIAGSWTRDPNIASFAERRIRRIYPGLLATTALSIAAFSIFLRDEIVSTPVEFVLWIFCQLTFLQSWNAGFIKSYATGYSNVALWTIPIELAFYVMTPILLTIGQRTRNVPLTICSCTAVSFLTFAFVSYCYLPTTPTHLLIQKVFLVSPLAAISWFWMFGIGMLANHYKGVLIPFCVRNIGILILLWGACIVSSFAFEIPPLLKASGNDLGLFNFILTSALALAVAYRFPNLSDRILLKSDFSYGFYIYHFLIINLIVATGGEGMPALVSLIGVSVAFSALSWFFIESPFLRRQSRLPVAVTPRA